MTDVDANKLPDGFYWVVLPDYDEPEVAELCTLATRYWATCGFQDAHELDAVEVLSPRLEPPPWKTLVKDTASHD